MLAKHILTLLSRRTGSHFTRELPPIDHQTAYWRRHLVQIYYRGRMEARNSYPIRTEYVHSDEKHAYLQGRIDQEHGILSWP